VSSHRSRHSGEGEGDRNPEAVAETLTELGREGPPTEVDTTDTLSGDETGSGSTGMAEALEAERKRSGQTSGLTRGAPVGRFIVIERIGAGGMGEVLAAYDPELDRRVAIKLLRSDSSGARLSELAHKRLLREAQAMAKLSHPNVITVYEVGTLGNRVFIAMEFVDGCTLTQWLRKKRPSWREIVDTYVRAGRGLEAAHDAGLVHRDFKPDNVLVGEGGRVRVTDFGLVAAAGESAAPAPDSEESAGSPLSASLTRTGSVMGTPIYMAPEQHRGQVVDGRADQFSFCVALYEALYGERPYAGANLAELQESLETGEVRVPPRDANVPSWLRSVLLRGLRTRPEARYASMTQLLEALQHDPTVARRRVAFAAGGVALAAAAAFLIVRSVGERQAPCRDAAARLAGIWDADVRQRVDKAFAATGRGYATEVAARVDKALDAYAEAWVTEHTRACAATYVHGEQSEKLLDLRMRCLERRRRELGALTQLLGERTDSDLVDGSVRAVFDLVDLEVCADVDALTAARPPPEDARTRKRVDAIRGRIDEASALLRAGKYDESLDRAKVLAVEAREVDYPLLQADALWLLASAQKETGAADDAKATLDEVVRAAASARDDALLARAWLKIMTLVAQDLGRCYEAQTLVPVAEAAVARAGGTPSLRADLYQGVGSVLFLGGQYIDAQRYLSRALELRTQILAPDSIGIAITVALVGDVYEKMGDYDKAFEHHRRALALAEKALGPEHPDLVYHLYNVGLGLEVSGEFDAARPFLERALAIAEKSLGAEHPEVATALANLGNLDIDQGRFDDARRRFERALRLTTAVHGPNHPSVAVAHGNMGRLLWVQGKYDESWEEHQRSLAIFERAYGRDHPEVAIAVSNLGGLAQERGDYDRAQKLYERALGIWQKAHGPNHPDVGLALNNLGSLLLLRGEREQSRLYQEHALAIFERSLGPNHPRVAATLTNLGNLLQAEGKLQQALDYQERAIAIKEATLGPMHPQLATSLNNLGDALYQQGDLEGAQKYLERALAIWERQLGPDHPDVGIPVHNLGNVYHRRGELAKARDYQQRALNIFEKALGPDHPYVAFPLTGLGKALVDLGQPAAAVAPLERALAIREQKGADEHDLAETQFALARALWGAKRDRNRALALARRAHASFAKRDQATQAERGEVADWLKLRLR